MMEFYNKQENHKNEAEISFSRNEAEILFPNLELDAQNPLSPEIEVEFEKQPLILEEGKSYLNKCVLIDGAANDLPIVAEAEELLKLPEEERLEKILDILRKQVNYSYPDDIDKLSKKNPDIAKWVIENASLESENDRNVPLSEIIKNGYGICRHLSVAYLWLAQKAGLSGVVMDCGWGVIKNIERSDNHQKMFKSFGINKPVSVHNWVEIKLSDGRWIPVDPSTKLVGNSQEGMAMFKEANYLGWANSSLDFEATPQDKLNCNINNDSISFLPGQPSATGVIALKLASINPEIVIDGDNLSPTNEPYSGSGKIIIEINNQFSGMNLEIIKVAQSI